jgi:hypothetical protein
VLLDRAMFMKLNEMKVVKFTQVFAMFFRFFYNFVMSTWPSPFPPHTASFFHPLLSHLVAS